MGGAGEQWLRNISFLNAPVKDIDLEKKINWPIRDRHQRMLVQVAMAMRPDVYEPKEAPPARRLYVIYQGAAYFRGRQLHEQDHWGAEDVMLRSVATRRQQATAGDGMSGATKTAKAGPNDRAPSP